ncbi:unnamed protein product [Chrysoparadoxa australica]
MYKMCECSRPTRESISEPQGKPRAGGCAHAVPKKPLVTIGKLEAK